MLDCGENFGYVLMILGFSGSFSVCRGTKEECSLGV